MTLEEVLELVNEPVLVTVWNDGVFVEKSGIDPTLMTKEENDFYDKYSDCEVSGISAVANLLRIHIHD